jgi:hypothetical protein
MVIEESPLHRNFLPKFPDEIERERLTTITG